MSTPAFRTFDNTSPRILVVDGSKVVRKMIEGVLRQQLPQAEIILCENGDEAKVALQRGAINLVTTALRLPDMDGLELARYLRERYDVGVELWSATSYKALRENALAAERWNRLHPTQTPRTPPHTPTCAAGMESPCTRCVI
jgi:CheY-like chemotaxis protein